METGEKMSFTALGPEEIQSTDKKKGDKKARFSCQAGQTKIHPVKRVQDLEAKQRVKRCGSLENGESCLLHELPGRVARPEGHLALLPNLFFSEYFADLEFSLLIWRIPGDQSQVFCFLSLESIGPET